MRVRSLHHVCISLRISAFLSPCRSALPGSMPSRFIAALFYSPDFLFLSELSYATPVRRISLHSCFSAMPASALLFQRLAPLASPFQNRAEQFLSTAIRSHRSHSAALQCYTTLIFAVSVPLKAYLRLAHSVPCASDLCNSVLMQCSANRCSAVPLPCLAFRLHACAPQ